VFNNPIEKGKKGAKSIFFIFSHLFPYQLGYDSLLSVLNKAWGDY